MTVEALRTLLPSAKAAVFRLKMETRANRMCRNMTPAERILWENLSQSPEWGYGELVEPQCIIGPYIVDFVVPGVLIEVDGSHHREEPQRSQDIERARALKYMAQGALVIRFTNDAVLADPPQVVEAIEKASRWAKKRGACTWLWSSGLANSISNDIWLLREFEFRLGNAVDAYIGTFDDENWDELRSLEALLNEGLGREGAGVRRWLYARKKAHA